MNIPAKLCWPLPGWIKLTIDGFQYCHVYARKRYRCTAGLANLPVWIFPDSIVGKEVLAEIETVEPSLSPSKPNVFDWLPFVNNDNKALILEIGDHLQIWNRYSEPFELLRYPPEVPLYGMLGLYQAEGSKSAGGQDFLFANSNVYVLAEMVRLLKTIGFEEDRMYLEVLHAKDEKPQDANVKYDILNVKITTTRLRPGPGNNAAILHIHNSMLLKRAICKALERISADGFPTKETALTYALHWLDGDATITLNQSRIELRLAGYPNEQRVVLEALTRAFDWRSVDVRYGPTNIHTTRVLNVVEAIDLATNNAFPFSMSRARLLLRLSEINTMKIERNQRERFFQGMALLKQEIAQLQRLNITRVNPKGAIYPLLTQTKRPTG